MKHTPHTLAAEVAEKPKETVFRASYRFLFRMLTVIVTSALAFILPLLWLILTRISPNLSALAFALVSLFAYVFTMSFIGLPMTLALIWIYRVRVKLEGTHGGTFWSTPVYMTFAEMESVEPRTVIGMPYLRVKSFRESCPTLWLPLFLADPVAFREHIAAQTAPTNPLRRSLESGNTAQKREPLPLPQ